MSALPIKCEEVLGLDDSIRFVGACSKQGQLIDVKYREGINPLLSDRELLYSIIKSVERLSDRKDSEDTLGPAIYSVTTYANVKRATITTGNQLYFVSFERNGNEYNIINKILKKINIEKI